MAKHYNLQFICTITEKKRTVSTDCFNLHTSTILQYLEKENLIFFYIRHNFRNDFIFFTNTIHAFNIISLVRIVNIIIHIFMA